MAKKKAVKKNEKKETEFDSKVLYELNKLDAEEGTPAFQDQIRVVQYFVDGEARTPVLEKRTFRWNKTAGEFRNQKAKGLTYEDLKTICSAKHIEKIKKALAS